MPLDRDRTGGEVTAGSKTSAKGETAIPTFSNRARPKLLEEPLGVAAIVHALFSFSFRGLLERRGWGWGNAPQTPASESAQSADEAPRADRCGVVACDAHQQPGWTVRSYSLCETARELRRRWEHAFPRQSSDVLLGAGTFPGLRTLAQTSAKRPSQRSGESWKMPAAARAPVWNTRCSGTSPVAPLKQPDAARRPALLLLRRRQPSQRTLRRRLPVPSLLRHRRPRRDAPLRLLRSGDT